MITTECVLIGSILKYPERFEDALDVSISDFTHPSNQKLWSVITTMDKIDKVALVETLRSTGDLEKLRSPLTGATGVEYIKELLGMAGTEVGEYAKLVIKNAIRLQLRRVAALIMADAEEEGRDPEEALDEAERRILSISRHRSTTGGVPVSEILGAMLLNLERKVKGEYHYAYVPNLLALRNLIDHAEESECIVVAARPGQGKSSLLRYEAYHQARNGHGVVMFNLENSQIEYGYWFIALATGIDTMKIRTGKLSPEELDLVRRTAATLSNFPLRIITMASPSVTDMERELRQAMRQLENISMIMIDYIQLVRNPWAKSSVENVTITSNTIRGWSLKYNIPLMVAAQLNREIERRGEKEPQLSDLRESGALEQDATMVIFPRPIWDNPTPAQLAQFPENRLPNGQLRPRPVAIPIRLDLKKSRNSPTGVSEDILWLKHTGEFRTLIGGQ